MEFEIAPMVTLSPHTWYNNYHLFSEEDQHHQGGACTKKKQSHENHLVSSIVPV